MTLKKRIVSIIVILIFMILIVILIIKNVSKTKEIQEIEVSPPIVIEINFPNQFKQISTIGFTEEELQDKLFSAYTIRYTPVIEKVPEEYRDIFVRLCYDKRMPMTYVFRQINIESGWKADIISKPNENGTKDYGIMQLNESYHWYFKEEFYSGTEEFDPLNPFHSLEAGINYLSYLFSILNDWELTFASYNCGIGKVMTGSIPPITHKYVDMIFK